MLKNPFGVRDGKVLVISDLSPGERGLQCGCVCPHCKGALLARMGEKKIHHFSHTKDACDETAAFLAGLFQLFLQIIHETGSFYAPALVVAYHLPSTGMTEANVQNYVRIIPGHQKGALANTITVAQGKEFSVENVSLARNTKEQPEALLISAKGRRLAIRILPPASCKVVIPKPYHDLSTLLFKAGDMNFHTLGIDKIRQELLNTARWSWLSNRKVEQVYDSIYSKYRKKQERMQKADALWQLVAGQGGLKQSPPPLAPTPFVDSGLGREEQEQAGYLEVKDQFTGQDRVIRDSYGTRWIKCELCSQIKPDHEFSCYGGIGRATIGTCTLCARGQTDKP